MKAPACFFAFAAGIALATQAEPLMLQPGEKLTAGAGPLNPGSQSIPCVSDWNGDGLDDLVVGYQPAFKIAVYLNGGSASGPQFSTFANIQAAGTDIYLPSSGCGSPAPWVCDYDGDGRRDLLVGAGENGRVWFYKNTNTDSQPVLAAGIALLKNTAELSVGARATPYVHDWDEDGLPDLLCGDASGYVHWFRNTGTRAEPVYTNDVVLQAGGSTLNFGYRSVVRVCDWDTDGIKDLLGSGSDNVSWCRNTGSNSVPQLSSPVRLQSPASTGGLANIDTGYRMRLEVADWNHDRCPDILIGNWDGYIYLYETYPFALTSSSIQDGKVVLRYNSAPYLNYSILAGPTLEQLTNLVQSGWGSQGKGTSWTNPNTCTVDQQFFRIRLAP